MDQAVVAVDIESAVRTWGRDHIASVERRVFFAVNNNLTGSQVTVRRIGGPDANCAIALECWAPTKAEAAELAAEVASEVEALARYVDDDVILHAAAWDSTNWFPDPESDKPRYVVDATFTASSRNTGS